MKSLSNSTAAAAVASIAFLAAPAQAAGNAAAGLQAMRELNLIVLGDLNAGHETEGKAFIGGNVTGNTSNFAIGNAHQGAAVSNRRTLTVGGNVGPGLNINQGSNGGTGNVATVPGILIGGNYGGGNFNLSGAVASIDIGGNFVNGNVNLVNGQTVNVGGNITANANGSNNSQTVNAGGGINGNANGAVFNRNLGIGWNAPTTSQAVAAERVQLQSDLQALSSTLSGLANTSNVTANGFDSPVINGVYGAQGFAVLNLTASFFSTYTDKLTYNLTPGLPLIVNVAGTGPITWGLNTVSSNASHNQSVIWNFFEATSINFTKMVNGSVLAPFATISNSTPIEGSVAVRNFNQGGEVHLGTYAAGQSFLSPPAPPPVEVGGVPEPASWAMLIAGFGLVGAAMRRRVESMA